MIDIEVRNEADVLDALQYSMNARGISGRKLCADGGVGANRLWALRAKQDGRMRLSTLIRLAHAAGYDVVLRDKGARP